MFNYEKAIRKMLQLIVLLFPPFPTNPNADEGLKMSIYIFSISLMLPFVITFIELKYN